MRRVLFRNARTKDHASRPQKRSESRGEEPVHSSRQATPRRSARWVGPEDSVEVAGRKIGGMIYVGPNPDLDSWTGSPFIDPSLPVAREASDVPGNDLPYWPGYDRIPPQCRASYLDWLTEGRSDRLYGVGYVFLYFYGIERRFYLDSPDESEKRILITETRRLLSIYGDNNSVRRYLVEFLDVAAIILESTDEIRPQLDVKRMGHGLPLLTRVTIGRMARDGRPLCAEWLLAWYIACPVTSLRTPARRAFAEFRALFAIKFDERFADGLKMRIPKRMIRERYSAASGTFEVNLDGFIGDIPDISNIRSPLNTARSLVEEATDELDKYSRFLGRNPSGRGTIEAHALLPQVLWPLFPCAEMEDLKHWAETVIETGGLVSVEEVIERLEGESPVRLGRRRLTGAADALARLSIGMAPDPRFALRSPKIGEPVVLFPLSAGLSRLEDVSEDYRNVLVTIALGSFIAHADGSIAGHEREALETRVESSELSKAERGRLRANLKWMLAVPPDLAPLRRRLGGLSESARHEFGQATLAMVTADGVVDPGEIKAIERLYRAIGLPEDGLYSDLHSLTATNEPITVRPADAREPEFAVPQPIEEPRTVVLSAERVATVIAETARASSILGEIFSEDGSDDELEREAEESLDDTTSRFAGLDRSHAEFLEELIERRHWKDTDFNRLAGQFGLMEAGAIETINEWSFEQFGDTLIEEYEGFEINVDVAGQIKDID